MMFDDFIIFGSLILLYLSIQSRKESFTVSYKKDLNGNTQGELSFSHEDFIKIINALFKPKQELELKDLLHLGEDFENEILRMLRKHNFIFVPKIL